MSRIRKTEFYTHKYTRITLTTFINGRETVCPYKTSFAVIHRRSGAEVSPCKCFAFTIEAVGCEAVAATEINVIISPTHELITYRSVMEIPFVMFDLF